MSTDEFTPLERAALALWLLVAHPSGLKAGEIASVLGVSPVTAIHILRTISRVVPITTCNGRWICIFRDNFPQS